MALFSNDPNDPSHGQNLMDHLGELRDRLVKAAYAIVITSILCWFFNEQIFNAIREPISPFVEGGGLVFTHPIDKFMAHVKVSLVCGIILACPIWLYQLWQFVAPGLYTHEKKYGAIFVTAGTGLFLVGASFAYFLVLPAAFKFLLNFGGNIDRPMITITDYMSFFVTMTLVFGLAFELPLVIVVLGVMGLVDKKFLREKRRVMIVILALISAIVTPPDIMSMVMLFVPLWALYEISIILVAMIGERKKQMLQ